MEKVVLSKGYEFEIVPNAVSTPSNALQITFLPGTYTAEQLLAIWAGNSTITITVDDTAIRQFKGYTVFSNLNIIADYLISTKYVCPECKAEVEPTATTCATCNAAFEAPELVETRGTVCTVKVTIPDINNRMDNAEDAIEDIIDTILG